MSVFCVSLPSEQSERQYVAPPAVHDKVFVTLRSEPNIDEPRDALEYVSRYMGVRQHFVRSESDFDYEYRNEANGIRRVMRAWVVSVDSTDFRGRKIIDFVIRFLPSPLYEIEKQIEHDEEIRRKEEKMRVAPVESGVKDKKEHVMTEEEIVRSYEKARRAAEQNASIPPSINGGIFDAPVTIPVDETDALEKNRERKAAIDGVKKEREARMLESMLRNREKIRQSVDSTGS